MDVNFHTTSCTVRVVPMSAPRIIPREWKKLIKPALTIPIVRSVVAALL